MNDLKGAIYNTLPGGRALHVVETRRLKQNAERRFWTTTWN